MVSALLRRLEQEDDGTPQGVRRQLLATSLRLTPTMAPDLHNLMERCRARLAVKTPVESYVYSSSQFNAACVKPEGGKVFVLFSSSLLEAFRGDELAFVVGHELGHHLYRHHDIPIGLILKGKERPPADLALKLFAWSRYAEVSADRAGVVCAGGTDGAAKALFRLSSGLRSDMVNVVLDDFAAQVEEMKVEERDPSVGSDSSEWFSTHPYSPLRLHAIRAFNQSSFLKEDGDDRDTLESKVQTILALMEPSYLEEQSALAESMRRVLFAGSIAVAAAEGDISEDEVKVFEDFFGRDSLDQDPNVEAITGTLQSRIAKANEMVPHARRIQVLRDLCLMSRADNTVHPKERIVLEGIADQMQVSRVILGNLLEQPPNELD